MQRSRWITVGTVQLDWYVIERNWGIPHGLYMNWRGRVSWCQPFEFRDWDQLIPCVVRRLRIAGLEAMALACSLDRNCPGEIPLLALVRRSTSPRIFPRGLYALPAPDRTPSVGPELVTA